MHVSMTHTVSRSRPLPHAVMIMPASVLSKRSAPVSPAVQLVGEGSGYVEQVCRSTIRATRLAPVPWEPSTWCSRARSSLALASPPLLPWPSASFSRPVATPSTTSAQIPARQSSSFSLLLRAVVRATMLSSLPSSAASIPRCARSTSLMMLRPGRSSSQPARRSPRYYIIHSEDPKRRPQSPQARGWEVVAIDEPTNRVQLLCITPLMRFRCVRCVSITLTRAAMTSCCKCALHLGQPKCTAGASRASVALTSARTMPASATRSTSSASTPNARASCKKED